MTNKTLDWQKDFKEILINKELKDFSQVVKEVKVGEGGVTYICQLWDGIIIWANSVHLDYIDYPDYGNEDWRYVALNICNGGRCEVNLEGDKYIYMTPGSMCISGEEPKEGFIYPGEFYEGIEIAFDVKALKRNFPIELLSYGISFDDIDLSTKNSKESYMATISDRALEKSKNLFENLCKKIFL